MAQQPGVAPRTAWVTTLRSPCERDDPRLHLEFHRVGRLWEPDHFHTLSVGWFAASGCAFGAGPCVVPEDEASAVLDQRQRFHRGR